MSRLPTREPKPHLMRSRIAAHAARLMAEDGIDDFAMAKRKAARQLGAPATQSLPNNEEIETELKTYRQLFQAGEHPALIRDMRCKALRAMRFLEKFKPYLTGSVLKGSAGTQSVINVQLFAANEKEVEFFLLDREIPFRVGEEAHFRLGREVRVCCLELDWEGTPLRLALYEPVELRGTLHGVGADGAAERAGIATVERLIEDVLPPAAP